MYGIAARGIGSLLKKFLTRPSGVKMFRGETLPYSAGRTSGTSFGHPVNRGRWHTTNPSIASRYATDAMGRGVPIIRSGTINPLAHEYTAGQHWFLNRSRGQLPVDRMRSIIQNLKQSVAQRDSPYSSTLKPFYGIKDLLRKIKDPKQREILKRLFFGDIRGLKTGGQV
mgnify:CR=1 FL=1